MRKLSNSARHVSVRRMSSVGEQSGERGSIAVVAAALLVAMLGLAALVIDMGHIFVVKSELQNAADVGALTGVVELIMNGESAAVTTATAYATEPSHFFVTKPRPQADAVQVDVLDPKTIQVRVRRTGGTASGPVPTFFASIWGMKTADVSALAIATVDQRVIGTGPGNLIPFAVHMPKLLEVLDDQNPQLNVYPFNWTPGDYGILDLDGGANSNQDVVRWIEEGYDQPFVIPPDSGTADVTGTLEIEGDTGISGNSLVQALISRLGDPVVIPVFTTVEGVGGNTIFVVTDLVGAVVTSYQITGNPADRYIYIDIIKFPSNDFITGTADTTPENPSLSKPTLIR